MPARAVLQRAHSDSSRSASSSGRRVLLQQLTSSSPSSRGAKRPREVHPYDSRGPLGHGDDDDDSDDDAVGEAAEAAAPQAVPGGVEGKDGWKRGAPHTRSSLGQVGVRMPC